jgi:OmpA-OmpF porin, OOP family
VRQGEGGGDMGDTLTAQTCRALIRPAETPAVRSSVKGIAMIYRRIVATIIAAAFIAAGADSAFAADVAGSRDHPLVGRYQGSSISFYQQNAFDEQRLMDKALANATVNALDDSNSLRLEGRVTRIRYDAPMGRSPLEIIRNYQDSLKAKGFTPVFSCANQACISGNTDYYAVGWVVDTDQLNYRYTDGVQYTFQKLARPEGDVYASVIVGASKDNPPIVSVSVVEAKPIETGQITFVDANQMAQSIGANGRVALYGILFDTDKADIKPDSKRTLDEIAKFLKATPNLSVVVAGHTDTQGAFDYNLDLSRRRALAVVTALTRTYGIPAARLTPFGAGMASPVASNDDEAGRAKNRRVELVKR